MIHQSSDYIHTCRQIVHDIQRRVCDKLSGGRPGYDEDELFGIWGRGYVNEASIRSPGLGVTLSCEL